MAFPDEPVGGCEGADGGAAGADRSRRCDRSRRSPRSRRRTGEVGRGRGWGPGSGGCRRGGDNGPAGYPERLARRGSRCHSLIHGGAERAPLRQVRGRGGAAAAAGVGAAAGAAGVRQVRRQQGQLG